jgi:hypothetical protein
MNAVTKKDGRSGISVRAELAAQEFRKADRLVHRRARDSTDALFKPIEAQCARDEGERMLAPPENLVGDVHTELVPDHEWGVEATDERWSIIGTLSEPTSISVDASEHRATVASRAGVLSAALDAAVSTNAANSIEKMLSHQLAAAHMAGMDLLGRVEQASNLPPVERARLTNAAARLFEVFQAGCLTLQKLKTGGRQHVVVQHQQVNVGQGGQAIVTGKLGRRSRNRGSKAKNGQ